MNCRWRVKPEQTPESVTPGSRVGSRPDKCKPPNASQRRLCVKESFSEAATSLRPLLGLAPSERAAEQMNQRMSGHAEAFQAQQSAPPSEEEGDILVATADGKGVPMRRPLEAANLLGPHWNFTREIARTLSTLAASMKPCSQRRACFFRVRGHWCATI